MVTNTGEMRRVSVGAGGLAVLLAAAVGTGCGVHRDPLTAVPDEPAPAETPRSEVPPEGKQVFFDDFDSGDMPRWEPFAGHWERSEPDQEIRGYAARPREFALTLAGPTAWSNYQLDAEVTIRDDRPGQVGVVARAQRSHHYFELVVGRDKGGRSWSIRQRVDHRWTVLASGPLSSNAILVESTSGPYPVDAASVKLRYGAADQPRRLALHRRGHGARSKGRPRTTASKPLLRRRGRS